MDIKVLVADTQPLTREGIIALLADAKGINIAGVATNIAELKHLAKSLKPTVIILDHQYDDNFSVTTDIKNIYRHFDFAGILILSNKQTRNEIMEVINLGIINYISKECTQNEIIDAVYATAKREKFFCLRTREILSEDQIKVNSDKDTAPLTTRETEIVQLIAEGMTNKGISEQLFLSIHTVKTHRKNIIKKLGFTFKNAADLMLYTSKRS